MASTLRGVLARARASEFLRNILLVMAGSGAAQAISIALVPVISRLFTPSDFGVSGSFAAVSGVIAAAVTLEYSQAIMLPREKTDAIGLLAVSLASTGVVTLLTLTACVLAPSLVNGLIKTQGALVLVLLVSATLISGTNTALQAWAVRAKAFRHTSASQVVRSLSGKSATIGFGLLGTGAPGLIAGEILGNVAASINVLRVLLPDLGLLARQARRASMVRLAKEYRDFPMYTASQGVINALSSGLPVLLLTRFFGLPVAGSYAFALSVLTFPMGLVLSALRQVLFQKASESQHQGRSLSALYVRVTATLFAMALLPTAVILVWGPQLFSLVFGTRWYTAGEFSRSLMIWMAVVFCNLPATLFGRIIRIQRFVFFYDLSLLALRTAALVLGGYFLSASQTVMAYAVVGAAMNAYLILAVGRAVMKKELAMRPEGILSYLAGD
ncbi:MAG TPA: oligosaccharide flippase family protein [Vicinamibacterales bacterium]|nr:oligosaccharide flippase family protein [Vicinamibacterales bacterium]HPK70532.1 oligosaccharide flippase family protein [Vicinamibacterales bacterium]